MTFRDSHIAFCDAIDAGVLSVDPADENYAGKFMYMGSDGSVDHFKHQRTRQYVQHDRD